MGLLSWTLGVVLGGEASPKDEIKNAIEHLGGQANYSWISTSQSEPGSTITRQGPTEGQTELNGLTHFRFTLEGNSVEAAFQGAKSVIKTESAWESSRDLTGERQWVARRLQAFKRPHEEAAELWKSVKSFRRDKGDTYSGDLTQEGVKALLLARSRDESMARVPPGAKGAVKFWIKNGVLAKYEYNLRGKIILTDHQQEFNINRTTAVEVKDVGSTKVQIPDDAKNKLN